MAVVWLWCGGGDAISGLSFIRSRVSDTNLFLFSLVSLFFETSLGHASLIQPMRHRTPQLPVQRLLFHRNALPVCASLLGLDRRRNDT
jgi:hypothetical protein